MQVKYRIFFCFTVYFISLKFIGIVFVSSSFDLAFVSIISSYVTTESSIILAKYFPFSQLHVAGFQI